MSVNDPVKHIVNIPTSPDDANQCMRVSSALEAGTVSHEGTSLLVTLTHGMLGVGQSI